MPARSTEPSPPLPGGPQLRRGWRQTAGSALLGVRARLMWPAFMVMSRGLRAGGRLGPPWFLKMLVRPQWLFESTTPIPHRPITATQPRPRGDADVALCARIIEAYRISRGYDDLSTIWSGKLARHYATLDAALLTGDPLAVEDQLRWMFRRPFLCGISTPVDYEDPAARRFWSLMTFDSLVSLAESVGAIGAENPEQGLAGRAFAEGIDHLPARIEAKLGISLDFPRVGAPYGVVVGDRLIVRETGRHLDAAVRLHGAAREHLGAPGEQGRRIVEVGAGFGGVAMWYIRLLGDRPGSYTIVDLPLMNAVQAYFLGGVYGGAAIVLNGETSARGRIRIVPPRILAAGDVGADVVYNQDSLPEMTESAARGYLDWMARSVSGIFVSCNHEAGTTASVAQVVVSELAEQVDGLQRISRAPSWTRRGYVEEIFRCRGSRAQP